MCVDPFGVAIKLISPRQWASSPNIQESGRWQNYQTGYVLEFIETLAFWNFYNLNVKNRENAAIFIWPKARTK